MWKGKEGIESWQKHMLLFEQSLVIFKEDTEKAQGMRKHILHCKHNVSFEDFVFLTAGPLENGVFYKVEILCTHNKKRDIFRIEMKKALQIIIGFPEFSNWHCSGKVPAVRDGFAEEIFGKNYARAGEKPSGYIRTLYRVRMAYEKYGEGGHSTGIRRLTSKGNELLGGVTQPEWINFLSKQYTKQVEEKLKRLHYLDNWVNAKKRSLQIENGTTKSDDEVGKQEKKLEAKIEQKDLNEETKVFVVRNALSSTMIEELKEKMNKVPFMPYYAENETEQKAGRRIRIVSEEYSEFIVGKGPKSKRFGSTAIIDVERRLLLAMNELIEMYAVLFENVLGISVRLADQLQEVKDYVKNGGYQKHNDQAGLCCRIAGESCEEKDRDGPEYMLVVTYVLSNVQERNTRVSWESGGEETAVKIETGGNDMHFQAINCQTQFMHQVEAMGKTRKKCGDNDYRLVFSARATMHFQENEEMQVRRSRLHFFGHDEKRNNKDLPEVRMNYKLLNVLHGTHEEVPVEWTGDGPENNDNDIDGSIAKKRAPASMESRRKRNNSKVEKEKGIGESDGSNSSNEKGTKKSKLKNKNECCAGKMKILQISMPSDTYANGAHHKSDPVRQNNPVIIDEPFYKLGTSNTLYIPQLAESIYYEVLVGEEKSKTRHFGPFLMNGRAATVGSQFKTSEVEEYLGIAHGGNDGSLCWNAEHPNGILMKHAYKNDIRAIKKIMEQKEAQPIWVGLAGGNPEVKGQTVLVGSKMTTNYESGYFPKIQKLSKQNVAILECALRNGTVTIFLVNDKDRTKAYYLGCYFLSGVSTHKESMENLRTIAQDCPEYVGSSEGLWCRFQERQHMRVHAVPYIMPEESEGKGWEKIVLHCSDVFPIGVEGGAKGQASEILSLTGANSVSFDEVLTEFIRKKTWRDLIEKDHNSEEDDSYKNATEGGPLVAGKGIQVTMSDHMTLMVCMAVGVFCRLQRMNVRDQFVTPLRVSLHDWFGRLGAIIQTYSSPHPGRVYDITPLTLITISDAQGEGRKKKNGWKWMEKNKAEMKELMFAGIVATTTGRITAFYHWSNYRRLTMHDSNRREENKLIFFPKTFEIEAFIEYLEMVTKDGKMGPFISAQFGSSLAPCFFSIEGYASFLRNVTRGIEGLCNTILNHCLQTFGIINHNFSFSSFIFWSVLLYNFQK
jgi:hypothetical protein